MQLTKDADELLCLMYKSYLDKRKTNSSKKECNYFGTTYDIHKSLLPDQYFDDADELVWELKRNNLIVGHHGDNILTEISLSSSAIAYMENRFKNGIKELADFISKLI